ncbi:GTP 3',8-cyclase MoaA [Candidatus Bathyarchaeota archaeon]|nr:GTP 3',8-cyclase MoaA [Candidatus Bathyarchaeota archaeon]MBS7613897.1 GTP 3',8-cyclase MoaA [Candidatus Bathyarchaeota archaeon]
MLVDNYGRIIDSVRISLTQKCNFNCFFCHGEGEVNPYEREMNVDEIFRTVRIAYSLGIRKVKLTGGEPLLRRDIVKVVSSINHVGSLEDLAITTNGFFLSELADQLKKAGLVRVNVSLPSLKPEVFKYVTGFNYLEKVLNGVEAALDVGLTPVKLNMVLLKNINEVEVWDMMEFSGRIGAILQIIELEPINMDEHFYANFHVDLSYLEEALKCKAVRTYVRGLHNRRRYVMSNGVEVEVVKPMHNSMFCANCTRIRITSDGFIKPCLLRADNHIDILTPMRRNASDEELTRLFIKAVKLREPFFK